MSGRLDECAALLPLLRAAVESVDAGAAVRAGEELRAGVGVARGRFLAGVVGERVQEWVDHLVMRGEVVSGAEGAAGWLRVAPHIRVGGEAVAVERWGLDEGLWVVVGGVRVVVEVVAWVDGVRVGVGGASGAGVVRG